jgi:hypothetical protein
LKKNTKAAIVEFLTVVKDQNAEFLKLCSRTYTKRLHADE